MLYGYIPNNGKIYILYPKNLKFLHVHFIKINKKTAIKI